MSKEAITRIEELGGTAISVHHTDLSLKALTRPHLFKTRQIPRFSAPVNYRDRLYYSDPANRGYLVDEYWNKCEAVDEEFGKKYVRAVPTALPAPPILFRDFLKKTRPVKDQ